MTLPEPGDSHFLRMCQLAAWGFRVVPERLFFPGGYADIEYDQTGVWATNPRGERTFIPYKEKQEVKP